MILSALILSHVPFYPGECGGLSQSPDVSQVAYLKGEGGIEIPLDDLEGMDALYYDVVLGDKINQTSYSILLGCGSCTNSSLYPPSTLLTGYEEGKLEPFTQTSYFPIFPEKTYLNISSLQNCTIGYFSLRLVQHSGDDFVWAAIVGTKESFTAKELSMFPIFILRNHGQSWNDMGYTIYVIGITLFILLFSIHCTFEGMKCLPLPKLLHIVALWAFGTAAVEEIIHLVYAQSKVGISNGLPIGIILILGTQGFGILFTFSTYRISPFRPIFKVICVSISELVVGLGLTFALGSGFFVGPIAIFLSGCYRLTHILITSCVYLSRKTVHPNEVSTVPPVQRIGWY